MSRVTITESLFSQIKKTFSKSEANIVLSLLRTLEKNPRKGKLLSSIGGVVLKELKYKSFRFYFITDGQILKFGSEDELASLLIKFVQMSDKKTQQKTIDEIKRILKSLGFDSL